MIHTLKGYLTSDFFVDASTKTALKVNEYDLLREAMVAVDTPPKVPPVPCDYGGIERFDIEVVEIRPHGLDSWFYVEIS